MNGIDVDDTTGCPLAAECATCDGGTDLDVVTLATPVGVLCATVCAACLDGGHLPTIAGWSAAALAVMAHCEHLGCDLDEMAAATRAEEVW